MNASIKEARYTADHGMNPFNNTISPLMVQKVLKLV